MQIISLQTTQANYVNNLTLGPDNFEAISVTIWNASVAMSVFTLGSGGDFLFLQTSGVHDWDAGTNWDVGFAPAFAAARGARGAGIACVAWGTRWLGKAAAGDQIMWQSAGCAASAHSAIPLCHNGLSRCCIQNIIVISYCYHPLEYVFMFQEKEYRASNGLPSMLMLIVLMAISIVAVIRGGNQQMPGLVRPS